MNTLLAILIVSALAQGSSTPMQSRVLMGDSSHCDALMLRNGRVVIEEVCTALTGGRKDKSTHAEVAWDGHVVVITQPDEKASAEWIRAHSLLSRLSVQKRDLYWDGKKVNLGKVDVTNLYEAIPWEGGVLIYGRTFPRRGFFESWFGHWFDPRDIEPFCAIYFDPNTLKGEDLWINGEVYRGLFVFPLPN